MSLSYLYLYAFVLHFVRTLFYLRLSRQILQCPDMNGFSLLWSKILDSSLWVKESKETRLVWITMLAMKNSEGVVQASAVGLADRAKVTPGECREALRIFLSPDPDDTSKVEEGRRIREIAGGWQIINHDLYRFSTEAKREFWRKTKAEQREKQAAYRAQKKAERMAKQIKSEAASRERRYVRADNNGDQSECDRVSAENMPGEPQ